MYTFTAGDHLLIYLGEPTSTNGHDVEVEFNSRRANFIDFDEGEMTLEVMKGITSNDDTGIYTVIIKLKESIDSLTERYKI